MNGNTFSINTLATKCIWNICKCEQLWTVLLQILQHKRKGGQGSDEKISILMHVYKLNFCVITLTVFLAYFSRAAPWLLKMATLALSRSFLSMPSFLGMEPTKMAASRSLKATSSLSVGIMSVTGEREWIIVCLNMLTYCMVLPFYIKTLNRFIKK